MEKKTYEKKLLKDIETFDKAYKDWNNKKLNEEEREKAQKIVDKMTDDYTDSGISEIRLKSYFKGKEDLIKQFQDFIEEYIVEDEIDSIERTLVDFNYNDWIRFKKKLKKEVSNSYQS